MKTIKKTELNKLLKERIKLKANHAKTIENENKLYFEQLNSLNKRIALIQSNEINKRIKV
jgi:hypothetical protein